MCKVSPSPNPSLDPTLHPRVKGNQSLDPTLHPTVKGNQSLDPTLHPTVKGNHSLDPTLHHKGESESRSQTSSLRRIRV